MQNKYIWQLPNWSDFTWQSDRLLKLLGEARFAQSQLLTQVKDLGLKERSWAQQELLLEETLKTASIEGEIYQRNSVRSSIRKHLGLPGGSDVQIEPHVDGLVQVLLDATVQHQQMLTKERLFVWHAALFPTGYSGFQKIETGQWRSEGVAVVSGAVGQEKILYEGVPAKLLEKEMSKFFVWWKNSSQLDGLLRAAIVHIWFVMIHPFADGNGRLARVLTEMALAQDENLAIRYYSLSSQIMDERTRYYKVLQENQGDVRDITSWLEWFLETFVKSIKKSKKLIEIVLVKDSFWRKNSHITLTSRQKKVLNRLLDVGQGNFIGGMTTRKYAALTKVSKATAFRELDDLLKKGMLQRTASKGRSVSYELELYYHQDRHR